MQCLSERPRKDPWVEGGAGSKHTSSEAKKHSENTAFALEDGGENEMQRHQGLPGESRRLSSQEVISWSFLGQSTSISTSVEPCCVGHVRGR